MGTHARAVSSPGRANSAWASPRERRLLGWDPGVQGLVGVPGAHEPH